MPWTASIEHLIDVGIERIEAHDQALIEQLLNGLPSRYRVVSPTASDERSTLVLVTHAERERNADLAAALQLRGIDVALRDDKLRISPHLYNSSVDVDNVLEALADLA
jgi:cysteine desulfurase / selenocysteine lyase